jgi:hypothetical protein
MYKLTAYAKTRRPLPGVNWRDLSDEEYEAALAANPGMDERGYFEHVEDINPSLADLAPDLTAAKEGFENLSKGLKRGTKSAEENTDD